ncbi:hypothetical protein Tco_0973895 [Tanacetum coccineum]|uniref:Reverse transcriptase domain-containing protein n=1 Tax=Tanacetum coccineum TaxID=301880 RepID=A0ABQ5EA95_9ASTR
MPVCDDFTTFSNPLFDSNDDFTFSDDESLSDEDVPIENFKIYSNPLFVDEEIISPKIDPYYFNAESNLIESLLNRDILIDSLPKFDYLLEEFSSELAHINPIPPGIEKADFDLEEEIRLVKNLLYDNSSPQQLRTEPEPLITFSPKSDPLHHEFTGEIIMIPPGIVRKHEDYINRMSLLCSNSSSQSSKNSHTNIESLPTSTTLIKNSDPNREEIDIFSGPDDSIPPGIESDFNSKEDIIDNLLNENPTHERLTFNIEPNALVINNVDKLNEDECFDPGGGENNVEVDDSFTIVIRTFLPFLTYLEVSPLLSSARNEDTILTPAFPLKAGGFSSGWNFRML